MLICRQQNAITVVQLTREMLVEGLNTNLSSKLTKNSEKNNFSISLNGVNLIYY